MNNDLLSEFNVPKKERNNNYRDFSAFLDKELLEELRTKIINKISEKSISDIGIDIIKDITDDVIANYDLDNVERNYLYDLINNEINGYGPLTEILKDDNITDIMVNNANDIYIEVDGIIKKDETISFINEDHIIRTLEKLLKFSGKSIDANNPIIDATLEDGSRINAIIPPLSKNTTITIRKFQKNVETIEDLISSGTLTVEMAQFLALAVEAKLNIIISGSVAGGKTTLLNILSDFINENERIITIEDVRELNLKGEHVISLETRNPNQDGQGAITLKNLVNNSIRMRPDRLIIGEIRGEEAFDYLQSINTGHDGIITTVHANSTKDALRRLETMSMISSDKIPQQAIKEYIANAVDLVVHIARLKDGHRKVTEITSVEEIKDGEIITKNIFEFNVIGYNDKGLIEGEFTKNTSKNKATTKIKELGLSEIKEIFKK